MKPNDQLFRKGVSRKLKEGDVRGAVRIITSEDSVAPYSPSVLSALELKHPRRPPDRRAFPTASESPLFATEGDVIKAIKSFPVGSSGGIMRLKPQHLKEALSSDAGNYRERLLKQVTSLVNAILSNSLPQVIKPVILGANITALNKKNGGLRPIAVGDTFRRIACKCAMRQVESALATVLMPYQLGCGVRAGIDAAVHFMRDQINSPSGKHQVFLKLDFQNAFNTIRRDHVGECVYRHFPRLIHLFSACYQEPSFLTFGDTILLSDEGLQRGDPLAAAYFCLGIHDIISNLNVPCKSAYLDDIALLGDPASILNDLNDFIPKCRNIGLELNTNKCEITTFSDPGEDFFQQISQQLPELQQVKPCDVTLLGAAMGASSLDALLNDFLRRFGVFSNSRLTLTAHDAFYLLYLTVYCYPNCCTLCEHHLPLRDLNCYAMSTLRRYSLCPPS